MGDAEAVASRCVAHLLGMPCALAQVMRRAARHRRRCWGSILCANCDVARRCGGISLHSGSERAKLQKFAFKSPVRQERRKRDGEGVQARTGVLA